MTVLGLDVGDRRVGVAVSDPTELLARPVSVLVRRSNAIDAVAIGQIVADLGIRAIVVGTPLAADSTLGVQAKKTRAYVKFLRKSLDVPIVTWDERFSTVDAQNLMISQNVARAKRRDLIDAAAAAVILGEWLAAQRSSTKSTGIHRSIGPVESPPTVW
jgi:putative Holliday junction resolvase